MINFKDGCNDLIGAFNLTEEDKREVSKFIFNRAKTASEKEGVSYRIRAVWLNESYSDNLKAFLIFTIGRAYQLGDMLKNINF